VRALDLAEHTFHRDVGLVHRTRPSLAEPAEILVHLIAAQAQAEVEAIP
jgi:hypothetical protein